MHLNFRTKKICIWHLSVVLDKLEVINLEYVAMISKVVSFVDFKTQSLQQTPDPSTGIEISEK